MNTTSLKYRVGPPLVLVLVSVLGTARCFQGDEKLASDRIGFVPETPMLRADPAAAAGSTCGPAAAPSALIKRRPYMLGTDPSALRMLWTSPAADASARVDVINPATGVTQSFAAERDPSARPVFGASLFSARLTGLTADTAYCYEVRISDQVVARAGFHTAPLADMDKPLRVLAFGDSGAGSLAQTAVFDQMRTVPFDMMIHMGDIAYENGTRVEFEQNFFDVYADVLERFPMFPASGNHEYETESAAPFREVFQLPENGCPEGCERWYSYDYGPVHFVVLDTELVGPAQIAWLEADLAAAQRPWTIVYFHRPPHSSGNHGGDTKVREAFSPLLERYGVKLVLSGHEHHYERTNPINGVTYIVTGGGGRYLRDTGKGSQTAYAEAVLHFVALTITRDRIQMHAIDGTGFEFDGVSITR